MSWRWSFALLLLVHGGIVAGQATGVPTSWLLGDHHSLGLWLTLMADATLIAAGASLIAHVAHAKRCGCRPIRPKLAPSSEHGSARAGRVLGSVLPCISESNTKGIFSLGW
jgi:hypothetical protein